MLRLRKPPVFAVSKKTEKSRYETVPSREVCRTQSPLSGSGFTQYTTSNLHLQPRTGSGPRLQVRRHELGVTGAPTEPHAKSPRDFALTGMELLPPGLCVVAPSSASLPEEVFPRPAGLSPGRAALTSRCCGRRRCESAAAAPRVSSARGFP